ncbi:nitroreductase family protein [Loigolactobacillus iwatensis]|uniref:nitroreductase family protein n=1 Tax=Loigolactobacillus iwatensis TaxID=1267156 RepID=UPI000F7D7919|nr:nitroreductase family protein [Loigolactobacillus iwatensis]
MSDLNATLALLIHHKTIRQFKPQPIATDVIEKLITTAQHTATSNFCQSYSIISVTDPAKKRAIAAISGQNYVASNGHLLIMVADQQRNQQLALAEQKSDKQLHSTDKFLAAVFDTVLVTQSLVVAAESIGVGSVILGSILNDAKQMIQLLELPPLTFPLLGLALGYPEQNPSEKPRLPEPAVHFTNRYPRKPFALTDYNQQVQDYYQNRLQTPRTTNYQQHIAQSISQELGKQADLAAVIQTQGFLLDFKTDQEEH